MYGGDAFLIAENEDILGMVASAFVEVCEQRKLSVM